MFDSAWRKRLAALALVAITAASIVYVQSQKAEVDRAYQDYQRNAVDNQQRATNKATENCRGIIARERFFQCAINQLEAYAKQDNANQDLKAQQDMAFWAKWLFYVTVIFGAAGVVLTLIGIKYVKDTLLETRRLGRAEIRSYLTCEGGNFEFVDRQIAVNILVKNTGNSPTSPITYSFTSNIYTGDLFDEDNFEHIETVVYRSKYPSGAISPGSTETIYIKMNDVFEFGESYRVLIRQHNIMFFMVLQWTDVFEEVQSTSFNLIPLDTGGIGTAGLMGKLQAFNHAGSFNVPPYGPPESLINK